MPEDFPNGDGNHLIHTPGAAKITLRDVLRKIEKFIEHCPGLTAVILVGREGDTSRIACTRTGNVPRSVARQMLRTAIESIDGGRIMLDDGPT